MTSRTDQYSPSPRGAPPQRLDDLRIARRWLVCPLLLLSACASSFNIDLPKDAPVQVAAPLYNSSTGKSPLAVRLVQPGSSQYERLDTWLAGNQDGWKPIIWNQSDRRGTWVSTDGITLQFDNDVVIAHSSKGMFYKALDKKEYAYLMRD